MSVKKCKELRDDGEKKVLMCFLGAEWMYSEEIHLDGPQKAFTMIKYPTAILTVKNRYNVLLPEL